MSNFRYPRPKKKIIPDWRLWETGLVIGMLALPGWVWCGSPAAPVPQPQLDRLKPTQLHSTVSPIQKWLPLGEVIQKYSKETGIRVRLSQKLQANGEIINRLYSVMDRSWLDDFSRIEIFNEDTEKKEILLLTSHPGKASARLNLTSRAAKGAGGKTPSRPTASTRNSFPIGNGDSISRTKLLKLIKGSYRSPLPVELYEDQEYHAFFAQFGVQTAEDLQNRNKAKKIRRAARRLLR